MLIYCVSTFERQVQTTSFNVKHLELVFTVNDPH